jgi:hypothetical protein
MTHDQIEEKSKVSLNVMSKMKINTLKAAILILAVIYVYYCVLYSIYLYLEKLKIKKVLYPYYYLLYSILLVFIKNMEIKKI